MRVGGARPPPLITFTLTSKVAVYAPAEWADTLTLFHLYQYMYSMVGTTVNWTYNQSLYTVTSTLERGEMSKEGSALLSHWTGITLSRVKDKASHCHGEKRNVKRYEREAAITKVSADGYGGWGCGANCKDSKRSCRLPLQYLFCSMEQYKSNSI